MIIEFNKPTWYSRLLSLVFIVAVLFGGFYFGRVYQLEQALINAEAPATPGNVYATGIWKAWRNGFTDPNNPGQAWWGYSVRYPRDFEVRTGAAAGGTGFLKKNQVLIAFPEDAFRVYNTNFAEAFATLSYDPAISELECYASPLSPTVQMRNLETVGAITYHTATAEEPAAGNLYTSKIYRTMANNVCFELVETIHTANLANFSSKTVTEFDRSKAQAVFNQMAGTLSFTDKNPYF